MSIGLCHSTWAYVDESVLLKLGQQPPFQTGDIVVSIPELEIKDLPVEKAIARIFDKSLDFQTRSLYFDAVNLQPEGRDIQLKLLEGNDLSLGEQVVLEAIHTYPRIPVEKIYPYLDRLTAQQKKLVAEHIARFVREYPDSYAEPFKRLEYPSFPVTQHLLEAALVAATMETRSEQSKQGWQDVARYGAQSLAGDDHESSPDLLRRIATVYNLPEVWLALAHMKLLDTSLLEKANQTFQSKSEEYSTCLAAAIAASPSNPDAQAFVVKEVGDFVAHANSKDKDFKVKFEILPALAEFRGDAGKKLILNLIKSPNVQVARLGLTLLAQNYPESFFQQSWLKSLPVGLRNDFLIIVGQTYKNAPWRRSLITKAFSKSQLTWMRNYGEDRNIPYLDEVRGNLNLGN